MNITERLIPHIEKAIGFNLYSNQVEYLLNAGYISGSRMSGKTVAYCIKLALSDGPPLFLGEAISFSDYGDGTARYAQTHFLREFMKYRLLLKEYGFPVREIHYKRK